MPKSDLLNIIDNLNNTLIDCDNGVLSIKEALKEIIKSYKSYVELGVALQEEQQKSISAMKTMYQVIQKTAEESEYGITIDKQDSQFRVTYRSKKDCSRGRVKVGYGSSVYLALMSTVFEDPFLEQ